MVTSTNILKKNSGFTIVELLVVIVVIGILAAITIVSYTGITSRANTTKAQSNAASVQSVAEIYFTENSHYPRATTDFAATAASKLPAGVCLVTTTGDGQGCGTGNGKTALNVGDGATTIYYQYCGDIAAPLAGNEKGGRIGYWDFTNSVTLYVYFGSGASTLGAGAAPCWTWVTPTA